VVIMPVDSPLAQAINLDPWWLKVGTRDKIGAYESRLALEGAPAAVAPPAVTSSAVAPPATSRAGIASAADQWAAR
jgi:hypothetical protein